MRRPSGGAPGTAPVVRSGPVALACACHPLPALLVTALAGALAAGAGHGPVRCASVTAAVLTGQLSVGWSNDAVDARRDRGACRTGKPVAAAAVSVRTAWFAAWFALVLCIALSVACGAVAAAVHLTGVGSAWAYNLRLKATVWSWLPYLVGFGSLPAFVALTGSHPAPPAWWAVGAAMLLGVGAHLADVLPDIADDRRTGVLGWPQRLGGAGARLLLPAPLLAATALLVWAPAGDPGALGALALAATAALAGCGSLLGGRWPRVLFPAAAAVAVVDAGLLLLRGVSDG